MEVQFQDEKQNTKILKACERITGKHISAIHDEAKGYAVKTSDGWQIISFSFANDFAGLGFKNECLLK